MNGGRTHQQIGVHVALALLAASMIARAQLPPPYGAGFAFGFNGTGNYLTTPHAADLNTFPLTLSAWVLTSNVVSQLDGIVSKYGESSLNGYSLFLYNGRIRGWYFRSTNAYVWDGSLGMDGGFIADGAWHHVTMVVDTTGGQIYVDGVSRATRPWTGTPGVTSTQTNLQVGRYWTYNNTFRGQMDEVRLWNIARTQVQIRSDMREPLHGTEAGLVAYYRFDQPTGLAVPDSTGNAAHTLVAPVGTQWFTSTVPFTPTAGTLAPTSLTASTATLQGAVNPNALAARAYLEWGTSPSYGNATAPVDLAAVTGVSFYSATLSNLATGVTYFFRAVATNNNGISYGDDQNFQLAERRFDNGPGFALEFDGIDDYLTATAPSLPTGNSAYTIEAWIKPDRMQTDTIAGWGIPSANGANVLRLTPTGLINYWWANDLAAPTPNLTGAWHHVAATFDGITRRLLLDGVVLGSDIPSGHNVSNTGFRIGSALVGEFFDGQMDEVRIWSVGRSAAQIQANMRRQLDGNEPSLVAYYRFNEGLGVVAANATGNTSNNAALINAPLWRASAVLPFAPAVETLPPRDVAGSQATVHGIANANLAATKAFFHWGTNTSYGNVTPPTNLSAANTLVSWTSTLPNLTPGLTYHYRAVATNIHGSSYGTNQSFYLPAVFTVSNTNDSGPGSLRQALAAARNGDLIPCTVTGLVVLTNGELLVRQDVTILGPGPDQLAISGGNVSRVFNIEAGRRVTIAGLTIRDGRAPHSIAQASDGGGIRNLGSLTLSNCVLTDNLARGLDGASGTGIWLRQWGSAPAPTISAGVLHLTEAQPDQNNALIIDDINNGEPIAAFTARFNVRVGDASPRPADGFSLSFGPDIADTPFIGDDGTGHGLRVSFDSWDNGPGAPFYDFDAPAIEVFYNNERKATVSLAGIREADRAPATTIPIDPWTAQPMTLTTDNLFRDVEVRLDPDGTVDVTYKAVKVLEDVPTGYQPTAGHWVLAARTGGAWASHYVSDLNITVQGPPPLHTLRRFAPNFSRPTGVGTDGTPGRGGAVLNAGTLTTVGCLFYNNRVQGSAGGPGLNGPTNGLPPGAALLQWATGPAPTVSNGVLRLTDAASDQNNALLLGDLNQGQPVTAFTAKLRVRMGNTSPRPADGFSLSFGPDVTSAPFPAEEGTGSGFRLSVDTWDNGAPGDYDAPAIEVFYGNERRGIVSMAGERVDGRAPVTPIPIDPATGQPMTLTTSDAFAELEVRMDADGTVDVVYKGVKVLDNVSTGYTSAPGAWLLAARTGGAWETHHFDDLTLTLQSANHTERTFRADFSSGSGPGGHGASGRGGAICNFGTLMVLNTTCSTNVASGGNGGNGGVATPGATGGNGGISEGGGIYNEGTLGVIQSTMVGNETAGGTSGAGGGGAANGLAGSVGGAGVHRSTGFFQILNSLLSFNQARPSGSAPFAADVSGLLSSLGHNLATTTNGSTGWVASDLVGSRASPRLPLIGSLAANCAAVPTHALLPNSPALDAGDAAVLGPPHNLTTDQRGFPRQSGAAVDIGAYETQDHIEVAHTSDSGRGSLREAIACVAFGGRITFAPELAGQAVVLTSGELVIERDLTLEGPAFSQWSQALTIQGSGSHRLFRIDAGRVRLSNLLLRGGRVLGAAGGASLPGQDGTPGEEAAGGAILNSGELSASRVVFIDNIAQGGRGGHTNTMGMPSSGRGGEGASALGGAICNFSVLDLAHCQFWFNAAIGGDGGQGGWVDTTGQPGGLGGTAVGGAVFTVGACSATNTLFYGSQAVGGDGGAGGSNPDGTGDGAGGPGGNGGDAEGGAIYALDSIVLVSCTLGGNRAEAGPGGHGAPGTSVGAGGNGGQARGGGLRMDRFGTLVQCTLAENAALGGSRGESITAPGADGAAAGGGLDIWDGLDAYLLNTLMARNRSTTRWDDVAGQVRSGGHNFIGAAEGSGGWSATDLRGTATSPLEADLGDFDGMTYPLLDESLALDAGDNAVLSSPWNLATDARGRPRLSGARVDVGAFEAQVGPSMTYTVLTTANSGQGSLRQAILDANAHPGLDTIAFNIPGTGLQTIGLLSPLPTVVGRTVIDGYSQPGAQPGAPGVLLVELNGAAAGSDTHGLHITAARCVVRGLVIRSFSGHGIFLDAARDCRLEGNYIGTDATGLIAMGNGGDGVCVLGGTGNYVGVLHTFQVISGNGRHGVRIEGGGGNFIQGAYIGVGRSRQVRLGNVAGGVLITNSPANQLVIVDMWGNNGHGLHIAGPLSSGNQVSDCYLMPFGGTMANSGDGARIENVSGGITLDSLRVSGNQGHGIHVIRSPDTRIQRCSVGSSSFNTNTYPNAGHGIRVENSARVVIGSSDRVFGNIIGPSGGHGVFITGSGSVSNEVKGNAIGTDPDGRAGLGNAGHGVFLDGASFNTIGYTSEDDAANPFNVIAGNQGNGVFMASGSSNTVRGNHIGTDAGERLAPPNGGSGVRIENSPGNAVVVAQVCGNGGHGVHVVGPGSAGNFLSVAAGAFTSHGPEYGNGLDGIRIEGAPGTVLYSCQVVGNRGNGVVVSNAPGTLLHANHIGTFVNFLPGGPALVAYGNAGDGVAILNSSNVQLFLNVIGAAGGDGIRLVGAGTRHAQIWRNHIGWDDITGSSTRNARSGIAIVEASNNQIGAVDGGTNWIAYNNVGLTVSGAGATNNVIRFNSIHSNTELGLDLGDDGLTLNDAGDADAGPNALQNYPILNLVSNSPSGVHIAGALNGRPRTSYVLDFFANAECGPSGRGQGQVHLGSTALITDTLGNTPFSLRLVSPLPPDKPFVTCTATDPTGNTSEFSPCQQQPLTQPPQISGIEINPVRVRILSLPGVTYRLVSKDALVPGPWLPVPGAERIGDGGVITFEDPRPPAPARFYLILIP